jgi:putative FmdB family regulatory protein
MPVYQFFCEKHGFFEKITIKAEWDDIRCPKCGDKPRMDKKIQFKAESRFKNINQSPNSSVIALCSY